MSFSSIFEISRADLPALAAAPRPRTAEAVIVAEIRARCPGETVAYGIDHKGPWARIGDTYVRRRPVCADALQAALEARS